MPTLEFKGKQHIYAHHLTVAYRENRILEEYFKNTLTHSSYILSSDQIDLLEKNLLADRLCENNL